MPKQMRPGTFEMRRQSTGNVILDKLRKFAPKIIRNDATQTAEIFGPLLRDKVCW